MPCLEFVHKQIELVKITLLLGLRPILVTRWTSVWWDKPPQSLYTSSSPCQSRSRSRTESLRRMSQPNDHLCKTHIYKHAHAITSIHRPNTSQTSENLWRKYQRRQTAAERRRPKAAWRSRPSCPACCDTAGCEEAAGAPAAQQSTCTASEERYSRWRGGGGKHFRAWIPASCRCSSSHHHSSPSSVHPSLHPPPLFSTVSFAYQQPLSLRRHVSLSRNTGPSWRAWRVPRRRRRRPAFSSGWASVCHGCPPPRRARADRSATFYEGSVASHRLSLVGFASFSWGFGPPGWEVHSINDQSDNAMHFFIYIALLQQWKHVSVDK